MRLKYNEQNTTALSNLLGPICYIVNLLFDQGCVSDQLKIADIIPVFKTGDTILTINYRPISILPVFANVCARLIITIQHFQFGFRKPYSIEMANSVQTSNTINDAKENKESVTGVFKNLAKVFDTVNNNNSLCN